MKKNDPHQRLLIQLETALHRLVESYWEEPYRYFTESDAVAVLHRWVAKRPGLAQVYHTVDGFETGLLHREYPTFFRLDDSQPTCRLVPPASRGHYDLVLMNPAFVQAHKAETVHNRSIQAQGASAEPPLLAAVEFKLFIRGWRPDKDTPVRRQLGKLRLALESPADVSAAYLCVFSRDFAAAPDASEYQQNVQRLLGGYEEIRTAVAVCWPKQDREPFVHYQGAWLTTEIA
jgi:hypothetical protein